MVETVGVDDRKVEASAPWGSVEGGDSRLSGGNEEPRGESSGLDASGAERSIDMYKGRFELDGNLEGDVDCSSEVSSSLLSFSMAGEPSSTAASLLRPRPDRPVKEVHAARIVFHANIRTRTTNVRCRMDSRRATTGDVSRATDAPDASDGGCGRCIVAIAMKSAGDERERLGRALGAEADPEGLEGRRKDLVDQVFTREREEDSEPVALRERGTLSVMNESCSVVGVDGGVRADASASN